MRVLYNGRLVGCLLSQIKLVVKLAKRWVKYLDFWFSYNIMECGGLVRVICKFISL